MALILQPALAAELTVKLKPIMDALPAIIHGQYGERYANEVPFIEVHNNDESWEWHFCLKSRNIGRLFTYRVGRFPSCCALDLFHGFSYLEHLSPTQVDTVLDTSLPRFIDMRNHRVQLMMVEWGRKLAKRDEFAEAVLSRLQANGIPMLPKEQAANGIHYPHIFNYFHKRGEVKTNLMWNANTGNIIHSMEVLLNNTGVQ